MASASVDQQLVGMVQPLVAGWRGATRRTFPVVVAGDRVTHIAVTTRYHGEQMSSESLAMCPKSALCRLTVGKHKPVRASTSVLRMQSCQANPENLYAIYVLSITVQLLLLIVKKIPKKFVMSPIPFIVPKAIQSTKFHHLQQLSTTL